VVAKAERSEVDRYLDEPGIDVEDNALEWWRFHAKAYPTLANMARVYLAVPASSAPSERSFSVGTQVLTPRRRSMQPDRVSRLMFMKYNMQLFRELSKM